MHYSASGTIDHINASLVRCMEFLPLLRKILLPRVHKLAE